MPRPRHTVNQGEVTFPVTHYAFLVKSGDLKRDTLKALFFEAPREELAR
ncbi:MAG: hypothetical protein KY445_04730 [Armatimonadetes bacterium]|nr:hypothetical protein [Armatimonadota bacterium]